MKYILTKNDDKTTHIIEIITNSNKLANQIFVFANKYSYTLATETCDTTKTYAKSTTINRQNNDVLDLIDKTACQQAESILDIEDLLDTAREYVEDLDTGNRWIREEAKAFAISLFEKCEQILVNATIEKPEIDTNSLMEYINILTDYCRISEAWEPLQYLLKAYSLIINIHCGEDISVV